MIRHETDGDLSLPVRLVVDGRSDCALFEVGRHFHEKVARNQLHFSFKVRCSESAADRQAVHCIDVDSRELRNAPQ